LLTGGFALNARIIGWTITNKLVRTTVKCKKNTQTVHQDAQLQKKLPNQQHLRIYDKIQYRMMD